MAIWRPKKAGCPQILILGIFWPSNGHKSTNTQDRYTFWSKYEILRWLVCNILTFEQLQFFFILRGPQLSARVGKHIFVPRMPNLDFCQSIHLLRWHKYWPNQISQKWEIVPNLLWIWPKIKDKFGTSHSLSSIGTASFNVKRSNFSNDILNTKKTKNV